MTATPAELTVKARLRNFGDGILVVADDSVKFYVEAGRFRKKRKFVREIPTAEIESVERQENDLTIVWKENTDIFAIAQPSLVEPIHKKIMASLKIRTKDVENKETTDQKHVEFAQLTVKAMETADSLFDILKDLHGRVDWSLVENGFKQSEENVKSLTNQAGSFCLGITQLSAAVLERRPKEIAEKTYDVLKTLHGHFDGMGQSSENAEQIYSNHRDARLLIQVSYILNDMLLGLVVGDGTFEKEGAELMKVLDDLARVPNLKIDVNAVKTSFDKTCAEKEEKGLVVEEIRLMLEQQLKELIAPTQVTSPTNTP